MKMKYKFLKGYINVIVDFQMAQTTENFFLSSLAEKSKENQHKQNKTKKTNFNKFEKIHLEIPIFV